MQAADDATLSQYYDGWTYQAGYQGAVVIHQFAGWPYMVQNPPFGAQTVALVVPSGSNNTNEFASMSQVFTNQYPGLYPLHFYAAKNPDWPVGALCIFVDEAAVAYFAATNFDASYRLITTNLTLAAGVHTLTLLSLREVPGHSLDLDGVGFGPPPPPPRTNAITLTAASPAYADVLAKINYGKFLNPPLGSIDGDTLVLPAGTNVWTNGITISGITLRGSGTNVNGATCILDAVPLRGNQAFLINAIARSNAFTRVTGICFGNQSSTNKQYTKVELDFRSANPANIRLDHCMFDKLLGDQVSAHGLYGVALIDHCSFINTGTGGGCIMAFGETYYTNNSQDQCGDLSYALPSWYGSSNQLTVEDCYFYKTNPAVITGTAIDSYAGARFTFRHNVITNNLIATHGTDSGGRVRGPRHYEIYGNNMNTVGEYLALELRGGTGLVWSNTAAGPHPLFGGIENYRSLAGWNPFGGASGTNAWDLNDPTCYLTGVCSGNTTNYLQVATNNWPVNSYVGFMVVNLDTGLFSYVTSSSETGRVDYASYLTAADQVLVFSDGQNFAFYKVERAMDQVGNGMGDLILGDYNTETKISHTTNSVTGTVSWPNQIVDPVYCWSNTYNNVEGKLSSNYPTIREAISWTNAVRANYTPLAYPHPLNK